jgi:dTDP-4-amino-4,6-dideoxygalactose transaminase
MIPIIDLGLEYKEISAELDPIIKKVLSSGHYILGPELTAFEKELAAYTGVKEAIGLNSGTDAVLLALRALDIGPGDEVIVPAMTFIATAEPVMQLGAKPVFVDIEPKGYGLDATQLEAKITSKTKAIMAVHLYGQSVDLDAILAIGKKRNVPVIEDNAQALGADYKGKKLGSYGVMACISFFPTKNLGACGDGGAVLTSSPELAERVKKLRNHGAAIKYQHDEIGYNSRLDEIQAAVLRVKLKRLDHWNEKRRQWAALYTQELKGTSFICPIELPNRKHIYHLYSIRSERRDGLKTALEKQGIAAGLHYPAPLHLQKAMKEFGHKAGDFPNSEMLAHQTLSLPLYAQLTAEQVKEVAKAAKDFERVPAA